VQHVLRVGLGGSHPVVTDDELDTEVCGCSGAGAAAISSHCDALRPTPWLSEADSNVPRNYRLQTRSTR